MYKSKWIHKKLMYTMLILGLSISTMLITSCMSMMGMCGMKGHGSHSSHNMQSSESEDSTLIRTGKIDVNSIDINLDGFVYQDPMHWNVISDISGKCPLCGMDLSKVNNKEAIKNLKEHGFEVKE